MPLERALDDPLATEADTLRRHAALRPDHVALIFEDRRTSYAELNQHANQVANGLLLLPPLPHRRVALITKNSDSFFEILFGVSKARMVALPVNWRLSAREIAQILLDARADVLFISSDFAPQLSDIEHRGVCFTRVFFIDHDEKPMTYYHWRNAQSTDDPRVDVKREDIFLQLYTSGTTGEPKGVQISHGASMKMRALEVGTGGEWTQWTPEDIAIVAMPNFHVGGTSWALQWLARGATCVVQAQVDAGAMLDVINRYRVTQLFCVPTVLDMMLAHPLSGVTDFSSLKLIHYGGAPISPTVLVKCMKAFGTGFVQYFGMTETNGVVSVLQPQDHDLARPELLKSCGKPYPALDLRIMTGEGTELPVGEVGEVCVDTPCLMSGYWQLPGVMAQSMHGAYYRTGDAGFKTSEGYLFLVDRVKDMIVSGGENIFPVEIERALQEHPGVAEVAVIGIPDERWGEAVKAIVVAKDPVLDQSTLFEFLKDRIARYKIPKSIDFCSVLPRNGAGKVLKRVLREDQRKK